MDAVTLMRWAIAEAELARGITGDNPWVGCVIVNTQGEILAKGHTQGPGEDHAEIAAISAARVNGLNIVGQTMYSTLEPCSFHGRTPACAWVIVEHRLGRVVIGMRDPNPRVDGAGASILRDAGIDVIEGVGEGDVRRQLGSWVFAHHPREPLRRARQMAPGLSRSELIAALAEIYAVDPAQVTALVAAS